MDSTITLPDSGAQSVLPEVSEAASALSNVTFRSGKPDDAAACGLICYEAFKHIAEQHNFPPDFPSPEIATGLFSSLLSRPYIYAVVAEVNGRVVGSNILWENDTIAGIGPITLDLAVQNGAIGRRLMENVLGRARHQGFPGVRLVQAAYHNRSLSLYTKLGFHVRELLSVFQGQPFRVEIPGYEVRQAIETDLLACNEVCMRVHGITRENELLEAIQQGTAMVVEHNGRITGYATLIGFFGHAVGESNEELKALIGAAPVFHGPGFMLPSRNADLFRWCLKNGLRVVQPFTLMTLGLYNEPEGSFLPSILY